MWVVLLALASLGSAPNLKPLKPGPLPILPADEVWAAQFDMPPAANAAMDDDRVYVPLQMRGIRALDRETGTPLWSDPVDLAYPPVVERGQLVVALPSEVRALDPETGTVRWVRALERPPSAALATADGRIFVTTDAGEALALDAAGGEVIWRRPLGAVSRHAPARSDEHEAIVFALDGRVLALDARTGATIWERALPGSLSAPAVGRDRVFVGSTNNFFYALDAGTGGEKWRWRTGGDVVGAAADGDRVYFVALDNLLRAVNRGNGNQIWKTPIPSRASAPPVAFGDAVVLAGVAPRVDAYNGRTGEPLGSFVAPADLQGMPVMDRTPTPFKVAIVAVTRDGRVSALRPIGLMFPDPPIVPLLKLPGRELPREPRPGAARLP